MCFLQRMTERSFPQNYWWVMVTLEMTARREEMLSVLMCVQCLARYTERVRH